MAIIVGIITYPDGFGYFFAGKASFLSLKNIYRKLRFSSVRQSFFITAKNAKNKTWRFRVLKNKLGAH